MNQTENVKYKDRSSITFNQSMLAAYSAANRVCQKIGVKELSKVICETIGDQSKASGNSGGLSLTRNMISLQLGAPIPVDVVLSGKISAYGKVKKVGGVLAKLAAAKKNKMKKIFLPRENEEEVMNLCEEIPKELKIVFVQDISEVLYDVFKIKL